MELNRIENANCVEFLPKISDQSVHLILSDLPYGIGMEDWDVLHNNTNSAYRGSSPAQAKAGKVFKARGKPLNGWSEADRKIPIEYYEWCKSWADHWLRILKPGASAIVFAGRRMQHRCVCALEDAGFTFKDMLGWIRPNAAHRAQRLSVVFERRKDDIAEREWKGWRVGNLRPVFEPILWFTKPYKIGTTIADNAKQHGLGGFNQQAFESYFRQPNNALTCGYAEGDTGFHPTQKPVKLMQALIELTTRENQIVLDPFAGSGSTLLAAKRCHRRFLGIELDPGYCKSATARLRETEQT